MVELGLAAMPAAWFSAFSISSHSPRAKDFSQDPNGMHPGTLRREGKWGSEKGSKFVT